MASSLERYLESVSQSESLRLQRFIVINRASYRIAKELFPHDLDTVRNPVQARAEEIHEMWRQAEAGQREKAISDLCAGLEAGRQMIEQSDAAGAYRRISLAIERVLEELDLASTMSWIRHRFADRIGAELESTRSTMAQSVSPTDAAVDAELDRECRYWIRRLTLCIGCDDDPRQRWVRRDSRVTLDLEPIDAPIADLVRLHVPDLIRYVDGRKRQVVAPIPLAVYRCLLHHFWAMAHIRSKSNLATLIEACDQVLRIIESANHDAQQPGMRRITWQFRLTLARIVDSVSSIIQTESERAMQTLITKTTVKNKMKFASSVVELIMEPVQAMCQDQHDATRSVIMHEMLDAVTGSLLDRIVSLNPGKGARREWLQGEIEALVDRVRRMAVEGCENNPGLNRAVAIGTMLKCQKASAISGVCKVQVPDHAQWTGFIAAASRT